MFSIARLDVLLITQGKLFVKHTILIDECKNKRKIILNYQCFLSQKLNETCKNYFEIEKPEKNIIV